MLFSGGRAALAHVGGARAFRLRGGQLRQITEDHTIGYLVADAACSRQRSHGTWTVDLTVRPVLAWDLRAGDRYLLCSADSARS